MGRVWHSILRTNNFHRALTGNLGNVNITADSINRMRRHHHKYLPYAMRRMVQATTSEEYTDALGVFRDCLINSYELRPFSLQMLQHYNKLTKYGKKGIKGVPEALQKTGVKMQGQWESRVKQYIQTVLDLRIPRDIDSDPVPGSFERQLSRAQEEVGETDHAQVARGDYQFNSRLQGAQIVAPFTARWGVGICALMPLTFVSL